ncbi:MULTISPECIES: hypothetical protein [Acetobacter]|nr:hypothetical protein [Acetobacter senegalensis]
MMPRTTSHPKAENFNFRIDPALKAAFTAATRADERPAAEVLRDFMRAYVARREQRAFETEARRQSREVAALACDPVSDEAQVLRELDALFEEDDFQDEWTA